jgi:transcriptional regulator with XRE-family HTH domain
MLKSAVATGELIRQYRLLNNYSQEALAEILHVTVSAVSSWERGLNKPSIDIALVLAKKMGISLDVFYRTELSVTTKRLYAPHEEFTFHKAYLKWQTMAYNDATQTLTMSFQIRGLSIDKNHLQNHIKITAEVNDTYTPVEKAILNEGNCYRSHMSPEITDIPLFAHCFNVQFKMPYKAYHDIKLNIHFLDEVAPYKISGLMIQTINKGIPVDATSKETTLNFIKSHIFLDTLKFYAATDQLETLQHYLALQAETLMGPLFHS